MIIVDSKKSIIENQELLEKFEEIYNNCFPDEMEREEFLDILIRVRVGDFPKTVIMLEVDGNNLLGGLVVDIYHNQIYHLTYLAIDDRFRGLGVSKTLVNRRLKQLIDFYGSAASGVFVETNIPHLTKNDSFDPNIRLKIFDKLGMKLIPISYIQPPLDPEKVFVSNLYLLYYPILNVELRTNEVIYFLNSLYLSLDQSIDNNSLKQMRNKLTSLGENIKLEPLPIS
jgi:hypothetical protein